ncbi:putative ankyrin repeat protein RF_0381 [Pecten maximus]|uniref:putative ankyrin repeat protein RF_0381 n=1 Tax=Pecten maximus TaxID=6579 RepID=UPI001459016D|nr:putative ankyrin repeat protein RF_0381 [Pecten maximus]XP_033759455.1 putative ankyrin repeat protein RF_0381 [Pecten maximus]
MSVYDEEESRMALRLYHAVEENNMKTLRLLLVKGADIHYKFFDDKSLLHICCEKDRLECAKLLMEFGANIRSSDEWNMTPLMYCMVRHFCDIAKELLSRDAHAVHSQDRFGKSVIHCAVESGSVELLNLVLSHGADVNQTDWYGITPLMTLCAGTGIRHTTELCRVLLDAGADLELKDVRSKRTALQFAAVQKNTDLVQCLVAAGADPNTTDNASLTPLTSVIFQFYRLKNSSCDVSDDLMTIVIILTQAGANLNLNTRESSNPLYMAVTFKVEPLLRFFLDCGADPNVVFPMGVTPLLSAVKKKDAACVRALLNWRARSNIRGRVFKTAHVHDQYWVDAMGLAVDQGCWDIVLLLYSAGYNISRLQYLREGVPDSDIPESLSRDKDMFTYLQYLARNPRTLFHSTTLCMWDSLKNNIQENIYQLPLPTRIKQLTSPEFVLG